MTKLKHTHKYQRVKWGKNDTIVWRCILPDCTHYLHADFIVNKTSICHGCGVEFIITPEKTQRAKPKCDKCLAGAGVEQLDDLIKDILKDVL